MSKRFKNSLSSADFMAYAIVGLGAIIMIFPFYFMFVFATHTDRAILSVPPP